MKKLLILVTIMMFAGACGEDTSDKVIELRLAHTFNDAHPVSASYIKFAEKIEKQTEGAYKIIVYGNGQLGEQRANMELVQSGALDLSSVYVGNLENVQSTYQVITSPYMFKSTKQYREALNSDIFRENIYLASLDKGFIGLVPMDAGTRNFYNKVRPINTPEDLKGLKFRVSESQTAIQMTEFLGGIPVMMPAGEAYTALQQNLIDGAENNATYLVSSRQAEVTKYYSRTQHTRIPDMLIMSAISWTEMPEKYQKIFLSVAKEISTEFFQVWDNSEAKFLKQAEELGVVVNNIENIDPFYKLVVPMHESLIQQSEDHKELVLYINSIQ